MTVLLQTPAYTTTIIHTIDWLTDHRAGDTAAWSHTHTDNSHNYLVSYIDFSKNVSGKWVRLLVEKNSIITSNSKIQKIIDPIKL